mgnify:FL=1
MDLHFRPENAHAIARDGQDNMDILVASKSMSMFVMDPASQAVLRYAETHPHCTHEQLTDALVDQFSVDEVAETVQEFIALEILHAHDRSPSPAVMPTLDVEHFPHRL